MLPLHLCPSALQSTRWPRLSLTAIFSQHSSTPPLYELDCYLFTITSCTSVTEFLPFTLSLTAQHAKKPFLSILIFPFLFASLVSHFSASPSHPRHIYIYIYIPMHHLISLSARSICHQRECNGGQILPLQDPASSAHQHGV